jgi:predicted metalloendopeptidase
VDSHDGKLYHATPPTVTAYNNPGNELFSWAGILQPPYFDLYADDALNYGAGLVGVEPIDYETKNQCS